MTTFVVISSHMSHIRLFLLPWKRPFQPMKPHAFDIPLEAITELDMASLRDLNGKLIHEDSPLVVSCPLLVILSHCTAKGKWAAYHVPTQGYFYWVATTSMADDALFSDGWNEKLEETHQMGGVSDRLCGSDDAFWPATTIEAKPGAEIGSVIRLVYQTV
jgi:hypothetical protein